MKTVKNYSPKTRILSLVLSFLIIFYLIPASVYAEGLDGDTTVSDNSVSENEENNTYIPEIYEVTELREENVKHFRLADGSYVAAQYNYPVHYTDENGEFEDIDNRLVESGTEFSTNNSRVKFIKKITGNGNIFTLHENNTKITMGLVGAEKKTKGVVTSNHNSDDAIDDTLGKMTNLENISSTILYEDILDGVDIEYVVHSLNIKENIIVKEKKDAYSYTFTLELNNLTASLADNGNVYINSYDSETQYVIPAPVVFDANGTYAPDYASAYTLTEVGNGKYELTVTVNASWMNAEERAFPVTIDPPMLSTDGDALDLNIDSNSPNSNTDGEEDFYVSSSKRAYVKFNENNFAEIPIGATLMKAELNIIGGNGSAPVAKVGAYEIVTNWDDSLTWNKTLSPTLQGTFGDILDYVVIDSAGRHCWNITELYNRWLNGASNYGIGLKLLDETSDGSAYFTAYEYYPDIDDTNLYAPVIMVTYIYNDGLEGYYPTATHSAGTGGAGSINLSTGRLTLAIPTLTTTDYLFAFTPTLVYNSSLAGKPATSTHTTSALSNSYMPYGFKLNIQETITLSSYRDAENWSHEYYILYDADGSTHRFYRKSYSGPFSDDDGLQLTLTVGTDEITIEDIDHNVKTYSKINGSSWYLTSIKDKYENELIFEHNTAYQPTKVIVKPNGLENIEMLRLLYEGDKLCAVYNNTSKDSAILRYSGGKLAMIQYCYGNTNTSEQNVRDTYNNSPYAANVTVYATASYTYDSSGNIVKITDSDTNKSIRYEITNGKITKLSEYAGTTLGQQVSYSYGEGYTNVRSTGNDETLNTNDDIITRYIFDGYGRSVSVYSMSSDEEKIYGATSGSYDDSEKSKNSIKSSTILGGVDPDDIIKNATNTALIVDIQGGIDKTEDTGCYKKTIFEAENLETLTVSNADMEFIISGFGKANSIIQNGYAEFSLGVNVYYYQGSGEDDEVVEYRFDFADVENVWQYVCGKFYCKKESTEEISYDYVSKIELVCTYYGHLDVGINAACAYFKDIALTEFTDSNGYNYSYNSQNGNLTDKENSIYKEYYTYDDENRITSIRNSFGEIYDFKYEQQTNQTVEYQHYSKVIASGDIELLNSSGYFYNEYGLLVYSSCLGRIEEGNSKIIGTTYDYLTDENSKIFGALTVEMDSLGNIIMYDYDSTNGNLISQIDYSTNTGYFYTYDEKGQLETVKPATSISTFVDDAENIKYTYNSAGYLTAIATDSTNYTLSYDSFGNPIGVQAGNNTLATYEYYPNNGKIKKINYDNGFSEIYSYDNLELLSQVCYNYGGNDNVEAFTYTYNPDGTLNVLTDHLAGKCTRYNYDVKGRLVSVSEKAVGDDDDLYNVIYRVNYDSENRVSSQTNIITYNSTTSTVSNLLTTSYSYTYSTQGNLVAETLKHLSDNHKTTYNYDNFNRLSTVINDFGAFDYSTNYTYVTDGNNTSYLIDTYTSTVGNSTTKYYYEYDSKGNITSISQGGNEVTYTYDDLGQLIREYDGKFTKNFTYDDAGNITSIKVTWYSSVIGEIMSYAVTPSLPRPITTTTTLSYTDSEWGDLLTSFNGTTITYDEIGNPLSYYNGSAYTFTWEGRRLVNAVNGSNTMSFTYDDNGIRTSKTVNGVVHTYQLNGSQIVSESWGDKLIVYLYDASGSPIGMMYRTMSYSVNQWDVFWFEKNLQGDIVAVYNSAGTKVASYSYVNAWGSPSAHYINGGASTGAQYNPFRYRGYYYDTDLEMYYLQSRYYDPIICRFISPDSTAVLTATPMALTDKNLYAYCDNNPVMRVDEDGEFWNILIGAGIGAVVGFVSSVVSQLSDEDFALTTPKEFWAKVGVSVVGGAISGGLAASGVGIIGQIAVNAFIGGGSGLLNVRIEDVLSTKEITEGEYFGAALNGTLMGGISGAIGGPGSASKHVSNSFWRMVSSGGRNMSYYFSQINTQAVRDGLKAISSIIKAAIPSVTESVVHLLNQPVR